MECRQEGALVDFPGISTTVAQLFEASDFAGNNVRRLPSGVKSNIFVAESDVGEI